MTWFTAVKHQRAFTLIELLVVIAVVGILIALSLPSLLGNKDKAFDSRVKTHLAEVYHSGKPAWVQNDNDYPVTGASRNTDKKTLIGFLEAAEPEFSFVDATVGVAEEDDRQILTLRPQADVVTYVAKSLSGRTFCLQAVERRGYETADDEPIAPGLYWSWGRGALACGADSEGGTPGDPPDPTQTATDCEDGCPLPIPVGAVPEPTPTPTVTQQIGVGSGTPQTEPLCNDTQTPYAQTVLGDGPYAYWRFCNYGPSGDPNRIATDVVRNETLSQTALVSAASRQPASDTSTARGAVTSERDGYWGLYDNISCCASSDFSWGNGSTPYYQRPYTAEAWVRPSQSRTTASGYNFYESTFDVSGHFKIGWMGTVNGWAVKEYGTTACGSQGPCQYHRALVGAPYPITADTWYHVAATDDGTTLRLYVNGVEQASGASLTPAQGYGWQNHTGAHVCCGWNFGRVNGGGLDNYGAYSGSGGAPGWFALDEPAFYAKVLTQAELADHYAAGIAGPNPYNRDGTSSGYTGKVTASAPVAWYHLDERCDARSIMGSTGLSGSTGSPPCAPKDAISNTTLNTAIGGGGQVTGYRPVTGPTVLGGGSETGDHGYQLNSANNATPDISINRRSASQELSMEWWFALPANSTLRQDLITIVQNNTCGCSMDPQAVLRVSNGTQLEMQSLREWTGWRDFGTAQVNDGLWHHAVLTHSTTPNANWHLYVDGVEVGTGIALAPQNASTLGSRVLFQAGLQGTSAANTVMSVDEVAAYDRVLPASEVLSHRQG